MASASLLEAACSRRPRGARTKLTHRRLIALLVAGTVAAAGCAKREPPEPVPDGHMVEPPEQVSTDFVYTRTEDGVKRWDLTAAQAEIYDGGDVVVLTDLRVVFYDSTGAREGTLTGAKGTIEERNASMLVEGSVVLLNDDGASLRTERLDWSEEGEEITTEEYVEVRRGDELLTGYGLVATPDLSRAEVKSDVKVSGRRERR